MSSSVFSQEIEEYDLESQYEKPLTIDLDHQEEEEVTIKKKKTKRNVYYGKKTRKSFTRSGFGSNTVEELFNVLKAHEDPPPYVRDVYWYSIRKRKVIKTRKIDKANTILMHGPYVKKIGNQVIEKGIFYMGTKHGRWTTWNRYNILQKKEKYYKGWPKESLVTYHNKEKKELKEIIPIHHGERKGYYFAFHKNGNIAATGKYQFDKRIGIWREYYNLNNRPKREIIYSKDPFNKDFQPYIIREWNKKGKIIYEKKKYL